MIRADTSPTPATPPALGAACFSFASHRLRLNRLFFTVLDCHRFDSKRIGRCVVVSKCCGPGRGAENIGALVVATEAEQAAIGRLFKQVAEAAEAVVTLVETRIAALDHFLEHGGPDALAVAAIGHQVDEGGGDDFHRLGLAFLLLLAAPRFLFRRPLLALAALAATAGLAVAHQVVVINEFVAVGDQQVGAALLDAHTNHLLGVFAQFGDQGREVGVAGNDHEGVDMGLGVAQVQGIDDHADISRVLARLAHVRNFDQLEIGFVHGRLEALVAIPVAIGLLDDDAALGEQPFQHRANVEFLVLRIAHAQRDVLEVTEERHAGGIVGCGHEMLSA